MKERLLFLLCLIITQHIYCQEISLKGVYEGQAQFQIHSGKNIIPSAHVVVDMALMVEPMGKVTGKTHANNCSILGIAKPGSNDIHLKLDLTLSNCSYPDYNRRFNGHIIYDKKTKLGNFELNAVDYNRKPPISLDIKATLRRKR